MSRRFPEVAEVSEDSEVSEEMERMFAKLPAELNQLTYAVIGAAMDVHSELGPGFLEHVYEAALLLELARRGIEVQRQVEVPIRYLDQHIATARLDLLVQRQLFVELKAVDEVRGLHRAQLYSYLRATDLRLGLLINFNVSSLRAGIRRVIRSPSFLP